MKSKDVQEIVLSKYENGENPAKIFRDLNGAVSHITIKRWCKMISDTGSINLSTPTGRPRTVRSAAAIQKVKNRVKQKKPFSARKLARDFHMSDRSVRRILKDDLHIRPYKVVIEPRLTGVHKAKRLAFANWVRHTFGKEETLRILFSDEKLFDIDGIYNSQNDRVWAASRSEADNMGGIKQRGKFSTKVMVWLGVCSKGTTPVVILDNGSVNHLRYINEVLPVALRYGNKQFGNDWIFQQDGATARTHHLTQKWCCDNFPAFIKKDRWPPNSPDLNPLDYCIWDEFANAIKWDRVMSKETLIEEIKQGAKRIRQEVVLESCLSWTKRLYQLSKNDGAFLRK
jgi:AraC-like DNA-binding protein